MACVEVTGSLCWDAPEPVCELDAIYATRIINNNTPDTYPYIAPAAVGALGWASGFPTFTGWAVKGSAVQPSPGAENTRFTWRTLEMTRAGVANHYKITFEFDTLPDVSFVFHQNPSGPYRFNMPNDTLMNVVIDYAPSTPPFE